MRRLAAATAVVFLAVLPSLADDPGRPRVLSFEDRVAAQRAIEEVYYSHQIDASVPFDKAVPRALLEKKVTRYLGQTAALEDLWRTTIDARNLARELERMRTRTRAPERLREIFAALGNDPVLIQECLALPVLVDRLSRNFFAFDRRFHASARAQAEVLRGDLVQQRIDPRELHPLRTELEIVRVGSKNWEKEESAASTRREVTRLGGLEFETRRAQLRERAASLGGLREERQAFVVEIVLEETPDRIRIAEFTVAKTSWDDWWRGAGASYRAERAQARAGEWRSLSTEAVSCFPDNTWDNGSLDDYPNLGSGSTIVSTGSFVILWGGWAAGIVGSGFRYDPATDTWSAIAAGPQPRTNHSAVWTGTEMIIWAGWWNHERGPGWFNDGGRYDPLTDTWILFQGGPPVRYGHTAVWAGSRMIVWGGTGLQGPLVDGGRYDPETDTWEPFSAANIPEGSVPVGTDQEMLVWNGASGFRYDPSADTWNPISTLGAPAAPARVWTGSEMIAWNGASGGLYDPAQDSWAPMALGAPISGGAVWTGSEMIVWGGGVGARYGPSHDAWKPVSTTNAPQAGVPYWSDGMMIVLNGGWARYDPDTDTWTPIAGPQGPSDKSSLVWTGAVVLAWPRSGQSGGARYDPIVDKWTPLSTVGAPAVGKPIWTGDAMLVWDGVHGASYDPASDEWIPIAASGAPACSGTTVWTTSEMIVWCGTSGARYDPTEDRWRPMRPDNEPPDVVSWAVAVWAGGRVVLWGGRDVNWNRFSGGRRYDPILDKWSNVACGPCNFGYGTVAGVSTGDQMLVVGGIPDPSGGQYDPRTNTWTGMAQPPGPIRLWGVSGHSAIWTGSRMVIWSGFGAYGDMYSTGGRYDPITDQWTGTSTQGAPSGRYGHSAVWTDRAMIVWGGGSRNGGRYVVLEDSDRDGSVSCEAPSCAEDCDNCPVTPNPDQDDADDDGFGDACDDCVLVYNPLQDDGDRDGSGDVCDNCQQDYNPGQHDLDQDAEGDVCDLDDGAIFMRSGTGPNSIEWQEEAGFTSWNVYEGDLDVLKGTGVYTQVPGSDPLAARHCGETDTHVDDFDNPPAGKTVFSLVTGVQNGVEGILGQDSRGVERPNANPCP